MSDSGSLHLAGKNLILPMSDKLYEYVKNLKKIFYFFVTGTVGEYNTPSTKRCLCNKSSLRLQLDRMFHVHMSIPSIKTESREEEM